MADNIGEHGCNALPGRAAIRGGVLDKDALKLKELGKAGPAEPIARHRATWTLAAKKFPSSSLAEGEKVLRRRRRYPDRKLRQEDGRVAGSSFGRAPSARRRSTRAAASKPRPTSTSAAERHGRPEKAAIAAAVAVGGRMGCMADCVRKGSSLDQRRNRRRGRRRPHEAQKLGRLDSEAVGSPVRRGPRCGRMDHRPEAPGGREAQRGTRRAGDEARKKFPGFGP